MEGGKLQEDMNRGDDLLKLENELSEYKQAYSSQRDEIQKLSQEALEHGSKISQYEIENESQRRLIDRLHAENEQLLMKFDSVSKAARILEENENVLKKEIESLKDANKNLRSNVLESYVTRDDVIEKLKNVSLETKELIDSCEKATEEAKIFRVRSEELDAELERFKYHHQSLQTENKTLKYELQEKDEEIASLRSQLQSYKADDSTNSWENDVHMANNVLREVEEHFKTTVDESKKNRNEMETLKEEIECLKRSNETLQDQNAVKDEIIAKQNQDFRKIKATVDEYHSEISRLDAELKHCHERVSVLNENVEMINSENLDLEAYTTFKRSLVKFGSVENIENLLSKLLVLQEIEQFFETKLSPHMDGSSLGQDNDPIVTNCKQNTINKIKSYLEKALVTIEKLNDKMLRLRTEYENKLRTKIAEYENKLITKSAEISTLREVLSNATLYNKILEQALQQCKDNVQLDKNIENKTDELLTANETLLDRFEELYRNSERCSNFLLAKSKQLEQCYRILKLTIRQSHGAAFNDLFSCIDEIFEEVKANEYDRPLSDESRQLLSICEKKLMTKDYLKNTVETMSQEVKRLTSKVEHEMAEKIREIELLKGEVESVRTDNCELVNKIKNCNREIVTLSTQNYDLKEKLENSSKMEDECAMLKEELECLLRTKSADVVDGYVEAEVEAGNTKLNTLWRNSRAVRNEQQNLKAFFHDFTQQMMADLQVLRQAEKATNSAKDDFNAKLNSLMNVCRDLRRQHDLVRELNLKTAIEETISATKNSLNEKLRVINDDFNKLVENCQSAVETRDNYKNNISSRIYGINLCLHDMKVLNGSLHSFIKDLSDEFEKVLQPLGIELQNAVVSTFENFKSTFASNYDEVIKEMQDMNLELKKRGETISGLNHQVNELEKEKVRLEQHMQEKENVIERLTDCKKTVLHKEEVLEKLRSDYAKEMDEKTESIQNLSAEVETLKAKIRSKDDVIVSLENEISRNRDGDVSSMGTLSKTEDMTRFNDVEDSFEERYTKLRFIAVKMKKNIAELNQQLQSEKTEKIALQNKLTTMSEQAKRNKVLQEECDKLTDDVEQYQREIKELKKIVLKTDKSADDVKSRSDELLQNVESLKKEITSLHMEKTETETKLKNLTQQLENANNEKSAQEIVKKEKDKEIQSFKQRLKESEDAKKKLLNELEAARVEARKQSVLTLEMRDYEKTISDLTATIKEKQITVEEMKAKITTSSENNATLVQKIKQLNEQIDSFVKQNKIAEEQVHVLNLTIAEYKSNVESQEKRIKYLMQLLEAERAKNEHLTVQFASSSAEVKNLTEKFTSKERSLNEQVKDLLSRLTTTDETLKKKEIEFEKLKDDFEAYKVRAHSVLQKFKSENNTKNNEEKLQSEIEMLGRTIKELRKQLDEALIEIENNKAEKDVFNTTKDNLLARIKELSENVTTKTKELDTVRAEHKTYKLTTDTLINCYKGEVEKLKSNIEELMKQETHPEEERIENRLANEDHLVPQSATTVERAESDNISEHKFMQSVSNELQESEIEAIEESERYRKTSRHSLIPLDKLLEHDINDRIESIKLTGNEEELRQIIKSLEQQVKYLTSILNETEKNSARHEQQVAFLKEEVRRFERMFEREPHLQNTEYVKNVLFKFITLPIGDEKHRLITVLETILKLTPNEKQTLAAIAKGYQVDSKSGWTSFLGWT